MQPGLGLLVPRWLLGRDVPFRGGRPGVSAGRDRFSRVLPPGERTRAGRTVRVKCNGARTHARLAGARRAGPRIRCQALGVEAGPSPTQTLTHRPGAESPGPRTPPLRWVRLCGVATSRPVLWHRGLGRACSLLGARPGVTRAGQPCADSPGGRAGGWAARCGRTGRPRRPGVPGLAEAWRGNGERPGVAFLIGSAGLGSGWTAKGGTRPAAGPVAGTPGAGGPAGRGVPVYPALQRLGRGTPGTPKP